MQYIGNTKYCNQCQGDLSWNRRVVRGRTPKKGSRLWIFSWTDLLEGLHTTTKRSSWTTCWTWPTGDSEGDAVGLPIVQRVLVQLASGGARWWWSDQWHCFSIFVTCLCPKVHVGVSINNHWYPIHTSYHSLKLNSWASCLRHQGWKFGVKHKATNCPKETKWGAQQMSNKLPKFRVRTIRQLEWQFERIKLQHCFAPCQSTH